MVYDVKITVVRMLRIQDLINKYSVPGTEQCPVFKVGEEFVSRDYKMPEGFCDWAWVDIQRDVVMLASGGNYWWCKEKGVQFSCCTAGLTPVVFKLKRIEEQTKSKLA